ncbi:MAG: hypothetical protein ACRDA3_13180 [Peptostreptococcaceae bacterium]
MKNKTMKVAKYTFKTGMNILQSQAQPANTGIEPLTVMEKLSKNIDIKVEIKNLHNPKDSVDLKKCQLVVYLNGKVKYVSKKGAIQAYTFERTEADWKVWHFVNHRKVMYGGIGFKGEQERKHFYKFCELCRVCYKIDAEFEKLRKEYIVKISA